MNWLDVKVNEYVVYEYNVLNNELNFNTGLYIAKVVNTDDNAISIIDEEENFTPNNPGFFDHEEEDSKVRSELDICYIKNEVFSNNKCTYILIDSFKQIYDIKTKYPEYFI